MIAFVPDQLPVAVAVKVRIDGVSVLVIKTKRVGPKATYIPVESLPLTENSFVELEFFDGADRLLLPARVSEVGETELKLEYEQTGATFEHWLKVQGQRSM